ncbi:Protein of unknown function [Propionibacterium freudenreichii subsp. freudenreichii]|uniref:Uncharacterized protein n=1 Tax=Propionibacterium freudenreichii subsp. freudenreichii TaxID=66712 RepID=A0A0B7P1C0_PROFF|nr:Protein of unknown function [Propionibacterium freudenreichii]CEI28853.1 Protein of unknown function [Propionibacterium freudenreichii]CEP27532.1 Protein of unknown function [Propionibacterium freudenreichii subsp. freudenreichii]
MHGPARTTSHAIGSGQVDGSGPDAGTSS